MKYHDKKYPYTLVVRITEKQNRKLTKELKKGRSFSDVIRELINTL